MIDLIFIITVVFLATLAGWALWRSSLLLTQSDDKGQPRRFIQRQVRYQTSFFVLAVVVAVLANSRATHGSGQVFGIGAIASPVQTEDFGFAHMGSVSWLLLGSLLTLGFGLVTWALVSDSLRGIANRREFLKRFGSWVIVLSAANALSEEFIYRGAIVAVAQGLLEPTQIALLSAVLFALAHVRGQASGIAVVAGSAVVGWCLAHAVLQTHGLFWAWCAHFVQDVIIFSAFITATANSLNVDSSQSDTPVS